MARLESLEDDAFERLIRRNHELLAEAEMARESTRLAMAAAAECALAMQAMRHKWQAAAGIRNRPARAGRRACRG